MVLYDAAFDANFVNDKKVLAAAWYGALRHGVVVMWYGMSMVWYCASLDANLVNCNKELAAAVLQPASIKLVHTLPPSMQCTRHRFRSQFFCCAACDDK